MPSPADIEDHHHRHLHSTSESVPLRPSAEHSYRSESESEDDISELDTAPNGNHQYKHGRKWPWTARFRRIVSGEGSGYHYEGKARLESSRSERLRGCCWRRRYCLLITGILLAGLITLLSGGAFWVYKTAPKDGVRSLGTGAMARLTITGSNHLPGILRPKAALFLSGKQATKWHRGWSSV